MTDLYVPDMHCGKCVERISKALAENDIDFEVSLINKTVSIDGKTEQVKKAIKILSDLGFEISK